MNETLSELIDASVQEYGIVTVQLTVLPSLTPTEADSVMKFPLVVIASTSEAVPGYQAFQRRPGLFARVQAPLARPVIM